MYKNLSKTINQSSQNKKVVNLTLLLKEKDQEVRIAKQKAGFFARKHAEVLEKLESNTTKRSKRVGSCF